MSHNQSYVLCKQHKSTFLGKSVIIQCLNDTLDTNLTSPCSIGHCSYQPVKVAGNSWTCLLLINSPFFSVFSVTKKFNFNLCKPDITGYKLMHKNALYNVRYIHMCSLLKRSSLHLSTLKFLCNFSSSLDEP